MNFDACDIELMHKFEIIAFKFICILFSFTILIMMWKTGTGQHFFITANSL